VGVKGAAGVPVIAVDGEGEAPLLGFPVVFIDGEDEAVVEGAQPTAVKGNVNAEKDGDGVKWLKHYSSAQSILIVGDGDFSFSLALATAFGSAENLVATSLDSYGSVSFPLSLSACDMTTCALCVHANSSTNLDDATFCAFGTGNEWNHGGLVLLLGVHGIFCWLKKALIHSTRF
jgi:hypothetical protein